MTDDNRNPRYGTPEYMIEAYGREMPARQPSLRIPESEIPRVCVVCTHFTFDLGTPNWSDITPGDPPEITCRKGHWEVNRKIGEREYRLTMLTALKCPDFEIAKGIAE